MAHLLRSINHAAADTVSAFFFQPCKTLDLQFLLLPACCDLVRSSLTLSPACLGSWQNIGSRAFKNTSCLVSYKLPYALWWCSGSGPHMAAHPLPLPHPHMAAHRASQLPHTTYPPVSTRRIQRTPKNRRTTSIIIQLPPTQQNLLNKC